MWFSWVIPDFEAPIIIIYWLADFSLDLEENLPGAQTHLLKSVLQYFFQRWPLRQFLMKPTMIRFWTSHLYPGCVILTSSSLENKCLVVVNQILATERWLALQQLGRSCWDAQGLLAFVIHKKEKAETREVGIPHAFQHKDQKIQGKCGYIGKYVNCSLSGKI